MAGELATDRELTGARPIHSHNTAIVCTPDCPRWADHAPWECGPDCREHNPTQPEQARETAATIVGESLIDRAPDPDEALGRVIVAEYADDSGAHEIGAAIAYTDKPTYVIEGADGRHTSWIAGLCRFATPDEEINYWKARAFRAEGSTGE